MRDKEIQAVIDHFNTGAKGSYITSQPIGANVRYGLVWTDLEYHTLADNAPYKFYFITNQAGKCIGAVLDMHTDLHWYITPGNRKKGYLSGALNSVILPHLSRLKKEQKITINKDDIGEDNFIASFATAKKSGFIKDESVGKIKLSQRLYKYKKIPIKPVHEGMSHESMVELRKKVNNASAHLRHVQAELEMKLGASPGSGRLKKLIEELESLRNCKLDDMLYDFNDAVKA